MSDWEDDDRTTVKQAPKQQHHHHDDGWNDEPPSNNRNYSRPDNQTTNNNYRDGDNDGDNGVTFTVPKSNVGLIIGRGGSKIKELKQRYSVSLKIGEYRRANMQRKCSNWIDIPDKEGDPNGDAAVTIRGADRDVQDAKKDIMDLVNR